MNNYLKEIIALVEGNNGHIKVKQDMPIKVDLHISYHDGVVTIPIEGKLNHVYFSHLGNEQLLTMELLNDEIPIYLDYDIEHDYLMLAMSDKGMQWNDTLDEKCLPNDMLERILNTLKEEEVLNKC